VPSSGLEAKLLQRVEFSIGQQREGTEGSTVQGAQLVLFCVKSTDTESGAAAIKPHLALDAVVLSLQNGGGLDDRRSASRVVSVIQTTSMRLDYEIRSTVAGHRLQFGAGGTCLPTFTCRSRSFPGTTLRRATQ
jgi:ketopantoate reductase